MQPPPFRELQDLTASERKLTLSERADPPPSGEEEDQLILTDLSIVTEMLQVVACPLRHAVVSAQETSKTSRKRLALLKLHAEEVLVAEEGNLYSPGSH